MFWYNINREYSRIWIFVNGADKYEYRKKSRVHDWLVKHY